MKRRKYYKLGREAGIAAGSWIIDGNTPAETARRILRGYEDGDPEVMDIQPSPLSGEWAGESMNELFGDDQPNDDQCADYEVGYSDGFWSEVIKSARVAAASE